MMSAASEVRVSSFSNSRHARLSVRPAQSQDLPEIRRVLETSRRAHLQLDWWTLEDWVGNPGFLVAQSDRQIAGLAMGVRDVASVAWLRALAAEDGVGTGQLLNALLPPMLTVLRSQGIQKLNCMAWSEWLADTLPEHSFSPLARVVTLRKDDLSVTIPLARRAFVREARTSDLDAIVAIDHTAFEPDWWFGQTTFFRAMRGASRFVIAERESQPVGYAFAHRDGSHAHITRVAVHPEHQGQGIGAQMMADLIEHSQAQGTETVTLNTQTYNQNSLRLYRRLGFVETNIIVTTYCRVVNE
jgi:ribosomal-protein-alanine N-acetyltransferase